MTPIVLEEGIYLGLNWRVWQRAPISQNRVITSFFPQHGFAITVFRQLLLNSFMNVFCHCPPSIVEIWNTTPVHLLQGWLQGARKLKLFITGYFFSSVTREMSLSLMRLQIRPMYKETHCLTNKGWTDLNFFWLFPLKTNPFQSCTKLMVLKKNWSWIHLSLFYDLGICGRMALTPWPFLFFLYFLERRMRR